jgi:type III restriction enzyme
MLRPWSDNSAYNKREVNNLYKDREGTNGYAPIELIRATRPIIIVDEPQSVDGGLEGRGKDALDAMGALCTLRYSATHVAKHHMIYRLDAVDAYERKLVKQIEVASLEVDGGHNKPYVRLESTSNARNLLTARVEIDIQQGAGIRRQVVTVQDGDDLEQTTKRGLYANVRIGEIRRDGDRQLIEVRYPGGQTWLEPGQAIGGVDPDELKRHMIRRTIREHLEKEKRLRPKGIKVLSLFFIDVVEHYRSYVAGAATKGKYALMFEEEYARLARDPDYQSLFKEVDLSAEAADVHDGYFSIDKSGAWADTADNNASARENAERGYNLIMKDKEKLLSFDTKLKFIFSHSALREGWDNPNVFQICVLRDIGTELKRRQIIGRGLRLCVNQQGERVRGFEVNTLTVIATESYQDFAETLQTEIQADTEIKFGIVQAHEFALIPVQDEDGATAPLGVEESGALFEHLKDAGLVDAKGKVQDSLRTALRDGAMVLPERFVAHQPEIEVILRKLAGRLEIKDANKRVVVKTREGVLDSEQFKALWDRIKHKTTYRVEFDNDKLIEDCKQAVQDAPPVPRTRIQVRKADLAIGRGGVIASETETSAPVALDERDIELPDILTELQDRTQLTRRTLARVLVESGRLDDFRRNPQHFIDLAAEAINRTKRLVLVDGIRYRRIGDGSYYAQELFETGELTGYLEKMLKADKSVYDHVVFDSPGVERSFAEELEKNKAVKVYAKLPGWFRVPTPLGTYNPDWAILIESDGQERLYFVAETKGSLFKDDLRGKEGAKIACGKAHFEALALGENPAHFVVATKLADVLDHV